MKISAKALLFDLDGTLFDTAPDLLNAFNLLLQEYQHPMVTLKDIRHLLTQGSLFFIKEFFGDNLSADKISQIRARYLEIYSAQNHQKTQLFPGMETVLKLITEKKIPWGIVTNKLTIHTHETLALIQLPSQPGVIVCGDTLKVAKPNPEPLLHACKKLQLLPEDVVFLGDSDVDAQAGLNAGIKTVIFSHGYNSGQAQFENLNINGWITNPKQLQFYTQTDSTENYKVDV